MTTSFLSDADATVQAIAGALLHFVWQGAVLTALLALGLHLAGPARATLRHALACLVLAAMPLTVVGTTWLALRPTSPTVTAVATASLGGLSREARAATVHRMDAPARARALDAAPVSRGWLPLVFVAWLCGVVSMAVVQLAGWRRTMLLRRGDGTSDPLTAARQRLGSLCERLGITRPVRLVATRTVSVPAVIGWLRPVVLLPLATVARLTTTQLEAVLAHELAHIRRHDAAINALQSLVETLLFFHPAVWWASRQLRIAREQCCDDLAVAVCGDRVTYARALATLETLRMPTPASSLAADGGSLVGRIQRLAGRPPVGGRWVGATLSGVVAVVMLVAFGPTLGGVPAHAGSAVVPIQEGTWRAHLDDDELRLELRLDFEGDHRMNLGIDADQLVPSATDGLRLIRDAGTLEVDGTLIDGRGAGSARFVGNAGYLDAMAAAGFDVNAEELFAFAVHDVSLEMARAWADAGYGDMGADNLLAFRIHGVTSAVRQALAEEGYDDLTADRLLAFAIHGVTPSSIRDLAAELDTRPSSDQLLAFAIHGVSPTGIRDLRSEMDARLSSDQLIAFAVHGITPGSIRGLADSGLSGLSADQLLAFRIHGVTPAFIRELATMGYPDLGPDRLIEMRIHGVDGDFVQRVLAREGKAPSARRLVEMKIHGFGD